MMKLFNIKSLFEMNALACNIGDLVSDNDLITLSGNLGVGKTTFARYLIESILKSSQNVTSPTFNFVKIYSNIDKEIWHFDLYRIKNQAELIELSLEDAFNYVISIVEWPEVINNLDNLLPSDRLEIRIDFDIDSFSNNDEARNLKLIGHGRWGDKLDFL